MESVYKLSKKLKKLKLQLETASSKGFIRPSMSPWGSPGLLVLTKTAEIPMCIDYRAFTKQSIRNQVPLPKIDEVWDRIDEAK